MIVPAHGIHILRDAVCELVYIALNVFIHYLRMVVISSFILLPHRRIHPTTFGTRFNEATPDS